MKHLFITSFHPLISRNILSTNFLSLLKDVRIVILVPEYKADYFRERFGAENILIEPINVGLSRRDLFFRRLALAISPTRALYIKKRSAFFVHKNPFIFLGYTIPAYIFGNSKFFLRMMRFFDYYVAPKDFFRPLFDHYRPDLIFSTDIQNELDIRLLQEARKNGIKTLGMIRSWDNLTSKGALRFVPDKLIVQNEIIKGEAMRYNDIAAEKIAVIGVPHYDRYIKSPTKSRKDFFSEFGFDLNKKLILFSPIGNRYIRNNKTDNHVLKILSGLDINILVRIPPGDIADFEEFENTKAKIYFYRSGAHFLKRDRKENEIDLDDENMLAASLYYCDILVTGHSTMVVDASIFDKPIVIVGFEPEKRAYWDSIRRYYDYDYFRPIIESGGVKLAENEKDFINFINAYLANPQLDNDGRMKIVKEQCWRKDGKSAERLAGVVSAFF